MWFMSSGVVCVWYCIHDHMHQVLSMCVSALIACVLAYECGYLCVSPYNCDHPHPPPPLPSCFPDTRRSSFLPGPASIPLHVAVTGPRLRRLAGGPRAEWLQQRGLRGAGRQGDVSHLHQRLLRASCTAAPQEGGEEGVVCNSDTGQMYGTTSTRLNKKIR